MYFDFFIPELNVFIEVQGEQHYKFNKFFHRNIDMFYDQQYRDKLKTQWVAEKKAKLIELSFKDIPGLTVETFRHLVISRL